MKYNLKILLGAFALGLALTACQPTAQYLNGNITANNLRTDIPLTSHKGEPLQINSPQKGKVSAVFFGYTQCPDICPTTLGKMKIVMEQLGADADKVRVVFVTVDPERDTGALLKEYMGAFNPTFTGAYTDPAQTKTMANQFQVVYEKVGTGPNYIVNHTANLYLLDENGRTVVSVPYEAKPETITHDIKQMLAQYR
jgi:protein SCO1/2